MLNSGQVLCWSTKIISEYAWLYSRLGQPEVAVSRPDAAILDPGVPRFQFHDSLAIQGVEIIRTGSWCRSLLCSWWPCEGSRLRVSRGVNLSELLASLVLQVRNNHLRTSHHSFGNLNRKIPAPTGAAGILGKPQLQTPNSKINSKPSTPDHKAFEWYVA